MRFFILCVFISISTPLYAQNDPVSVEFLPEGRRCSSGGVEYMCYTLEEYKLLLQMDVNLQASLQTLELARQKNYKLLDVNKQLKLSIESYEREILVVQASRDRITEKWKDTNKKWLEEKHKPKFGSLLSWSLVLGEGAVILGLVTAMLVGR